MERVAPNNVVFVFCSQGQRLYHDLEIKSGQVVVAHTRCFNKVAIVFPGEQRVRQVSEKLLQQTSNAVDIVEEVLRVSEVELWRGCVFSTSVTRHLPSRDKHHDTHLCRTCSSACSHAVLSLIGGKFLQHSARRDPQPGCTGRPPWEPPAHLSHTVCPMPRQRLVSKVLASGRSSGAAVALVTDSGQGIVSSERAAPAPGMTRHPVAEDLALGRCRCTWSRS